MVTTYCLAVVVSTSVVYNHTPTYYIGQTMSGFGPSHSVFKTLDPQWCRSQCEWIIDTFPLTETSNSSGKFYHNYRTWHFHKSSELSLVKRFITECENIKPQFEKIYAKPLDLHFVVIAETLDDSQDSCVWHKDGYFHDGQMHLSVSGGGNIDVEELHGEDNITLPDGSLWYLNASHYRHKIGRGTGNRRIEITAPLNMRPELAEWKTRAVEDGPYRQVHGDNPIFIDYRLKLSKGVRDAVRRGTASNASVGFSIDKYIVDEED